MHEATHHATFVRPIISAFARQRLSAQMNALLIEFHIGSDEATEELDAARKELVRLCDRQDLFLEMLRPISEGLAQFAEFYSFRSRSYMHTSVNAGVQWFFGVDVGSEIEAQIREEARAEADEDSLGARISEARTIQPILEYRSSEDAMLRLKALYSLPMSSSIGGTYLAGLLAIRRLYFASRSRIGRFWLDSDLFLAYAIDFFYKDYQLVRLFYSNIVGEELIGNLHYIIGQRFVSFLYHVNDESLDAWVAMTERELRGEPRSHLVDELSAALLVDPEEVSKGLAYEGQSKDDWEHFLHLTGQVDPHYERILRGSLIGRALLPIGRFPVNVEVSSSGEMSVTTDGTLIFQASYQQPTNYRGHYHGYITVALLSPPGIELTPAKVLYFEIEGNLEDTFILAPPKDIERLRSELDKVTHEIWESHRFAEENEGLLTRLRGRAKLSPEHQTLISSSLRHILNIVVGWPAGDEEQASLISLLEAGGVRLVLQNDVEVLEGLCYLGPVNSVVRSRSDLRGLLEVIDLDGIIGELQSIQERTGYAMLTASADVVQIDL